MFDDSTIFRICPTANFHFFSPRFFCSIYSAFAMVFIHKNGRKRTLYEWQNERKKKWKGKRIIFYHHGIHFKWECLRASNEKIAAIWRNPVWLHGLLEYIRGWNDVIQFLHWSHSISKYWTQFNISFGMKRDFSPGAEYAFYINWLVSFMFLFFLFIKYRRMVMAFYVAFIFQDHFTCCLFFFAYGFWFN